MILTGGIGVGGPLVTGGIGVGPGEAAAQTDRNRRGRLMLVEQRRELVITAEDRNLELVLTKR